MMANSFVVQMTISERLNCKLLFWGAENGEIRVKVEV